MIMKPCHHSEATHLRVIAEPPMGGVTYHSLERDEEDRIVGVQFENLYSPMNLVELTAHHGVNCWFAEKEDLPEHPRVEYMIDLFPGEEITLKVGEDVRGTYFHSGANTYKVTVEPAEES